MTHFPNMHPIDPTASRIYKIAKALDKTLIGARSPNPIVFREINNSMNE